MTEFKYIIVRSEKLGEQLFIFPKEVEHAEFASTVGAMKHGGRSWSRPFRDLIAAGFTDLTKCYGRSESLKMDSRPEDTELLRGMGQQPLSEIETVRRENDSLKSRISALESEADALRKENAELRVDHTEWQPIETAPKDGDCLLAIETDDGHVFMQLERDKRGNWIHEGEATFCHGYYFHPTHWKPRPMSPKSKSDAK